MNPPAPHPYRPSIDPQEGIRAIREAFQHGPSAGDNVAIALWCILAIGATFLLYRWVRSLRFDKQGRVDHLREVCNRLGLSSDDLRDIRLIAEKAGLPYPMSMMLSPANFQHAIDTALAVDDDANLRKRIEYIGHRIFAGVRRPQPHPA